MPVNGALGCHAFINLLGFRSCLKQGVQWAALFRFHLFSWQSRQTCGGQEQLTSHCSSSTKWAVALPESNCLQTQKNEEEKKWSVLKHNHRGGKSQKFPVPVDCPQITPVPVD